VLRDQLARPQSHRVRVRQRCSALLGRRRIVSVERDSSPLLQHAGGGDLGSRLERSGAVHVDLLNETFNLSQPKQLERDL